MTKTTHFYPAPVAADLRLVAFMLARTLRALRSDRLERGGELLFQASLMVENLPHCEEKRRACLLLEGLGAVGVARMMVSL